MLRYVFLEASQQWKRVEGLVEAAQRRHLSIRRCDQSDLYGRLLIVHFR
jgi:hypothetical protein